MMTPAVLDVHAAAAYIGMSADWLAKSDCPRVRFGRKVRYRIVDLDEFIAQRLTHRKTA